MLIDHVGGNTLLAGEANGSFVQWVTNLNVKTILMSGFVNRDLNLFVHVKIDSPLLDDHF